MRVILTEKPSVAKDIAKVLGLPVQSDSGYLQKGDLAITWAFGHLVTLQEPEDYDASFKRWSLASLPIVPAKFGLKVGEDKGVQKQFGIISKLFAKASEIVCATDAGREGELIFRYILELANQIGKPCKRLWLSSMTEEAITKAFSELKPLSQYDNLYAAARCRSEADWIVGLNATRAYTVRYGRPGLLFSCGRVQTPVLALIVRRDEQILHFVSEPFWELFTQYRDVHFKCQLDRYSKKEKAAEALESCKNEPLVVEKIEAKQEKQNPPQLFDLTELQREMNKRYGMSAADTLATAQQLYEQKLLTYPRTDSRYLTADMKPQIPGILKKLEGLQKEAIARLDLSKLNFDKRVVDDKKVADHHAILPTGNKPGQLSSFAQHVFDAVLLRLIAVFYPPCVKKVTTVDASAAKVPFRAKGAVLVDPGWTVLYPRAKNTDDEEQILPVFTKGESGPHAAYLKEGKTQPPAHFNENTLLGAMETAGKLVEDEELKEALKERGLGTPATRASIIETLLSRGYVERNKKNIEATEKGRYLISLIQDPSLKSAEMTGDWEAKLKKIEQGRLVAKTFMEEIVSFTRNVVLNSDCTRIEAEALGNCPLCQAPVIMGKKALGCSRWKEGCTFVLQPEYKGLMLNMTQLKRLLQRRFLLEKLAVEARKVHLALTDKGQVIELEGIQEKTIDSLPRKRKNAAKVS